MVDRYKGNEAPPPPAGSAYYNWALSSGRAAYFMLTGETKRIPVLVELKEGVTIEDFASGEKLFRDKARVSVWRSAVSVAPLFDDRHGALKNINFVTALVTEDFFKLRDDPENVELQQAVPLVSLGPPLHQRHLPSGVASNPGANSDGADTPEAPDSAAGSQTRAVATSSIANADPPVIVGIIDDGIAFAHERFRKRIQTRIEYLWIQDGDPPTTGLPFGRELRANGGGALNDINNLLNTSTFANQIDDDEVYQRSRVIDFARPGFKSLRLGATHGTAVLDTAAGDPASNGRDDRPIIAVQLPTDAVRDTSLNGLSTFLFPALFYILSRSITIGLNRGTGPLPIVINLSYGNTAGPHDGTSLIERAIDQILAIWKAAVGPIEIVLPSGNSYLSRCHAQFRFRPPAPSPAPPEKVQLHWRVLPDDKTASYLQIWLPYQPTPVTNDRVRLRVIAPGGTAPANATAWLGETSGPPVQYPAIGNAWCQASYTFMPPPTSRGVFEIFIQPTASLDFGPGGPTVPISPSGIWTVEIENILLGPGETVEAWIQRDDTPFGYPRLSRQSYFDEAVYKRFDDSGRDIETDDPACLVKRAGFINAIATGGQTIVIGGFLRRELVAAKYSAGGPITVPASATVAHREGPDALAVSEDSTVHRGVLAAGSRSGSVSAMGGTSVAVPRIARWIADRMALGNPALPGDRGAVQTFASGQEAGATDRPPIVPPPPPNHPRYGAGRIELNPIAPLERYWE